MSHFRKSRRRVTQAGFVGGLPQPERKNVFYHIVPLTYYEQRYILAGMIERNVQGDMKRRNPPCASICVVCGHRHLLLPPLGRKRTWEPRTAFLQNEPKMKESEVIGNEELMEILMIPAPAKTNPLSVRRDAERSGRDERAPQTAMEKQKAGIGNRKSAIRGGKDEPRMGTDGHGCECCLLIRVPTRSSAAQIRNPQSAIRNRVTARQSLALPWRRRGNRLASWRGCSSSW
jgi:hypothetical protein